MIQGERRDARHVGGVDPGPRAGPACRAMRGQPRRGQNRSAADRRAYRPGSSGRHPARQFHADRRSRRDRRRRGRRGQRPERTGRRAGGHDGARPRGGFISAKPNSPLAARSEITAAGVGIVPEDRHAVGCVTGDESRRKHLSQPPRRVHALRLSQRSALREHKPRAMMQRFDVRAAGPGAMFSSLSGGNQQKAVLARELTLAQSGLPGRGAADARSRCRRGRGGLRPYPRCLRTRGRDPADLVRARRIAGGRRPHRRALSRPDHGNVRRRPGAARARSAR